MEQVGVPKPGAQTIARALSEGISHLGDFTTSPRVLVIAAIAVVVGTVGVMCGVVLLWLIRLVTNVAYFGAFNLANLNIGNSPLGVATIVVPIIGPLIVGLLARYRTGKIRGHGIPEAIEAILLGHSRFAVALGSGTSGGVLAPLLIMGGGLGAALAHLLPAASPGFWPLLAVCATMGGTMRSPLTATFFAVELTGNTHVLLPLVAACVTAHVVTVLLMRRSILTEKVARRGDHLAREYSVDRFALTRVADVMVTEVETLPDSMTLRQLAAFLTKLDTKHPSF
jgi:chloride channel protein, CIC family